MPHPLFLSLLLAGSAPPVGDATVASSDGVSIRYHAEGAGDPALVFVHCWSCDRHLWDGQVPFFAAHHKVVTLDLAGHGESGRGRKDWTIEAYGADVRAVVLALDLQSVVLIGHSMGGPVIVEAARGMPSRVAALVPVDTLTNVEAHQTRAEVDAFLKAFEADFKGAAAKFLRDYMFVPTTDPRLVEKIVTATQAAPPDIAIASLRSTWLYDAAAALGDVKAPVRSLNGDKYPTDVEAARRHASHFEVTIMKGVGHYLMLEDPARFNALLGGILDELGAPSVKAAR